MQTTSSAVPPPQQSSLLPVPPTYSAVAGDAISDELLESCAKLFSTNYGVWGEGALAISKFTKPGQRVKMTSKKLRAQCLSVPESTVLVTCYEHQNLVGHAFATVWNYQGGLTFDLYELHDANPISRCCWLGYSTGG